MKLGKDARGLSQISPQFHRMVQLKGLQIHCLRIRIPIEVRHCEEFIRDFLFVHMPTTNFYVTPPSNIH